MTGVAAVVATATLTFALLSGAQGDGAVSPAASPVAAGADEPVAGVLLVASDGGTAAMGDVDTDLAASPDEATAATPGEPIVGTAATPSGGGYWTVTAAGEVVAHGDASLFGRPDARPGHDPIIALAGTSTGSGYWLVTLRGTVIPFGDAAMFGDVAAFVGGRTIAAVTSTASGAGLWLATTDGTVVPVGDATDLGAPAATPSRPITGITATDAGTGIWLTDEGGQVYPVGEAPDFGSADPVSIDQPVTDIAVTPGGDGYWLLGDQGKLWSFGDAAELSAAKARSGGYVGFLRWWRRWNPPTSPSTTTTQATTTTTEPPTSPTRPPTSQPPTTLPTTSPTRPPTSQPTTTPTTTPTTARPTTPTTTPTTPTTARPTTPPTTTTTPTTARPTTPPTTTTPTTARPTTPTTTPTTPTTARPTTPTTTPTTPTTARPTTPTTTPTTPTTARPTTTTTPPTTPPGGGGCALPRYPTPSCTGVPAGTALRTISGDLTANTNGQVIDGVLITGSVRIAADNVVIRNSEIRGTVWNSGNDSFTVEDSTIGPPSGCHGDNAVGFSNYTLRRVHIRNFSDGPRVSGSNILIEDSFMLVCSNSGDHSDGVQGYQGGTNVIVRHNTIDQRPANDVTAAVFFADSSQSATVKDNLLMSGAGYVLRIHDDFSPDRGPWVITGNRIVNGAWGFGASLTTGTTCSTTTWSDNTLVTIDASYRVTGTVGTVPCG